MKRNTVLGGMDDRARRTVVWCGLCSSLVSVSEMVGGRGAEWGCPA